MTANKDNRMCNWKMYYLITNYVASIIKGPRLYINSESSNIILHKYSESGRSPAKCC